MLRRRISQRKLLKNVLFIRKDKISMKNGSLKIDSKPKSKTSSQSLSTINRKFKTKLSYILRNQIRNRKKQKSGRSKQAVEGVPTVERISEFPNKDSLNKKHNSGSSKQAVEGALTVDRISELPNKNSLIKKRKSGSSGQVIEEVPTVDRVSELPNKDSLSKKRKSGCSKQAVEGVPTAGLVSELPNKDSLKKELLKRRPKRKLSCLLRKQIRERKKRKMGEVNGIDGGVEIRDRISELPEPIIHHIMSFLHCPSDVARTVVLSKKWKIIWNSFYAIDFDQRKFVTQGQVGARNNKFKNYVENSLATKLETMLGLQKFRLYLTSSFSRLDHDLTRWVSAAINKNVKELEIHVEGIRNGRYVLPKNALTTKTLTSLKLSGCKLDNYRVMDLPHLKELSIKKACLSVDMIQSFIRRCPLVEDLRLVHCIGLGSLFISDHPKLKRVEVHECHGLKVLKVDLPNLTSFWYCGKRTWDCKINLAVCESLKYLTLQDSNMTNDLFHNQLLNFPNLEKLVLKECNILETIIILSLNLRGLSIIRCRRLEEVLIYAPSLVSLEYTGSKIPFSSLSAASLVDVKLHFEHLRKVKSLFFDELQTFIEKFKNNEAWKLVNRSNKNVTIYEELGEIQFLPSNTFYVELTKSSMNFKKSVDNLLQMSHPKTLSLISSPCSEFLKSLHEKMGKREMNPSCCSYYTKKCWLHYLEDFEIERSTTGDIYLPSTSGEAESQEVPTCITCSASSHSACTTTFNLKWRPGW